MLTEIDIYAIFKNKLQILWDSLTEVQKSNLFSLWDNGIFDEEIFEPMVDDIIKMEDEG